MATSRTPDEMLQDYKAAIRPKLGPAFHRLYNDNAWLHMKWNDFLKLFVKSPAQMRDLNTAAPGFFHQVQELWWDDMLLHIFRMTDKRTDVLSVYTFLRDAPAPLKAIVETHIAIINRPPSSPGMPGTTASRIGTSMSHSGSHLSRSEAAMTFAGRSRPSTTYFTPSNTISSRRTPRTTTPSTTSEAWTACSTSSTEDSRAVTHSSDTFEAPIRPIQADWDGSATVTVSDIREFVERRASHARLGSIRRRGSASQRRFTLPRSTSANTGGCTPPQPLFARVCGALNAS